ncbi:MAG: hypothetical protein CMH92_16380 [Oceanicaulis sp.]|nr:hypothetical protein [Oceanicaulis sp.]
MKPGRPRKYQDAKVLAERVDAYFADTEARGKPPTVAGLCYFLGFEDRHALTEYESYGPDFSSTVKGARLRLEIDRSERLIFKDSFTPGLIFDLKNNHGWKDKTEADLNHGGQDGNPVVTRIERVLVDPEKRNYGE